MADNDNSHVLDQHSLANIPDTIAVTYLPNASNLSTRSLQRGLNYFTQGYIHNIQTSDGKGDKVGVDAKCWRSMKKSQPPHRIHIEINPASKQIEEGFCSCKAGINGHCSHIIGLVKSLQGLKLHNFTHVPELQSCTSLPQQWHVPRGEKINPVPINHVVVARPTESRKRKPMLCQFDTNYRLPDVTADDFSNLRGLAGTPMANVSLNTPKISSPVGDVQLGCILSYQTRNLKKQKVTAHQRCGNVLGNGQTAVSLPPEFSHLNKMDENFDTIALEQKTRAQADSELWRNERATRITSSNFGKILKRKSTPTPQFLESIFSSRQIKATSLEYGKRHEGHAKTRYLETFPDRHLHECGFFVSKQFDFLGSSPDGKVCDAGKTGLIEVKCPYKARQHLIAQACKEFKDFCLEVGPDGSMQLKRCHEYYAQVQGQLMITGGSYCDFVVYTQKDLFVERILPDVNYMKNMLVKLATFFKDHGAPFLQSRNDN